MAAACSRAPQTKEAVRQGVVEHISKNSGLEVNSMDVEVVSVAFEGKQARAQVSFRPKGSADSGMQMGYTLESDGSKWVVKGKGAATGGNPHGPAAPQGDLPAGHPPLNPR